MSEEIKPNAGDILASKLGVNTVNGSQLALKFLVTALLATLRSKGALTDSELDAIMEVATDAASDIFKDTTGLDSSAVEYASEVRDAAEKTLARIRSDIERVRASD